MLVNSVGVGAPGNPNLRASFQNRLLIKIMQTAREGLCCQKGQEGPSKDYHNSKNVCRGLKAGLWLPLFRQTLKAIFKQPTV